MDIRDKPRRDRENRVVAVRDIAWRKNKRPAEPAPKQMPCLRSLLLRRSVLSQSFRSNVRLPIDQTGNDVRRPVRTYHRIIHESTVDAPESLE